MTTDCSGAARRRAPRAWEGEGDCVPHLGVDVDEVGEGRKRPSSAILHGRSSWMLTTRSLADEEDVRGRGAPGDSSYRSSAADEERGVAAPFRLSDGCDNDRGGGELWGYGHGVGAFCVEEERKERKKREVAAARERGEGSD